MKARMRTIYYVTVGDTEWRGDCPVWARGHRGQDVTIRTERTLWLGPKWFCHCPADSHG
jgi:hypothetical protein